MRRLAIPALLLACLVGLVALAPAASAATALAARPAPDCDGFLHVERDLGPVTVSATPGQCYDVYVDAFSCPLGGRYQTTSAGPVHVHLYVCDAPNPPPPPTPTATAAGAAPDCSKVPDVGTTQNGVITSDDCQVLVSVDAINCPFGEQWVTNRYGPLTVRHTVCREPVPPAVA